MNNTTLQQKLILSINALLPFAPRTHELKRISALLQHRAIPNDDYRNVFNFILLLLRERPDVMSNQNGTALKELCQECINQCSSMQKRNNRFSN